MVYSLIVGSPVTNCQADANSDVTDTTGGSITIGETWSDTATIGVNFGNALKIEATAGWSQTQSIEYDQKIAIVVHPGQMGVLVANVQYKRTNGSMQIGKGQDFPVVSNQPTTVLSYGPEIVPCASQFSANISSPMNCTSNAQMWWKGSTPSATSLALLIAIIPFSISLVA